METISDTSKTFAVANVMVCSSMTPVDLDIEAVSQYKGLFPPTVRNAFDLPALYQITKPVDHGECPTWDPRTNNLYFVDIHMGRIFSFNIETKDIHSVQLSGEVAPIIPTKKDPNVFIVGLNRSVVELEWDQKSNNFKQKILTSVQKNHPRSRMNDGKADKRGRLWLGTMGYELLDGTLTPNEGILHRITKNNILEPTPIISPVNISNGLAWNKENNKFFYIDSPTQKVMQYDYNDETGEISNAKVAFDLIKNRLESCYPDGMTIDVDDNLWIALYGGGSVIKVNPYRGILLQRIAIPAEKVTSVAWGGPNLDILFVTTSRYTLTESQRAKEPAAGSVFAITNLGTKGLPMFEADI